MHETFAPSSKTWGGTYAKEIVARLKVNTGRLKQLYK